MKIRFALYEDDLRYTPALAHEGDACYDLFARSYALPEELGDEKNDIYLAPGQRVLARTGVYLQLEPGWEALVRPRSGNALKHGLTVLNTPGTIDAGYRNEVGVILHNAGGIMLELKKGQKIAQLAFRQIPAHSIEMVTRSEFDANTRRGLGGFGSSGG